MASVRALRAVLLASMALCVLATPSLMTKQAIGALGARAPLRPASRGAANSHAPVLTAVDTDGNSQEPVLLAIPSVSPARLAVPLYFSSDSLHYNVKLSVGTPGLQMSLLLDLGSSDLMLLNDSFCKKQQEPAHTSTACFDGRDSSSFISSRSKRQFSLQIDGELVSDETSIAGSDKVTWQLPIVGTTASETLSARCTVILSSRLQFNGGSDPLHYLPDSDGLIGAAFNALTQDNDSPFLQLLGPESDKAGQPTFSLDLNANAGSSRLLVGGIDERYRSGLTWGETHNELLGPKQEMRFHTLQVYNMSICGYSITQDIGPVFAIIDTGSSCLNLPGEIFDMVMSWVPASCVGAVLPTLRASSAQICYLPEQVRDKLPTLDFQLNSDPDGRWLHLPLEMLLLPVKAATKSRGRRFCVQRGPTLAEGAIISFGARSLQPFMTVLHMPTGQVGMANKAPGNGSRVQCLTKKRCKGMQTHYEPLNMCKDPDCDNYYFFTLDDTTKTCTLSTAFHTVAIILILAFAVTELGLNEVQAWLTARVYRNVNAL